MSRTREVQSTQSPVEANIYFNGKLGKFSLLGGDDSELQELPYPFRFIVVDDGAHRVTGAKGLGRDAPKWKSTIAHAGYKNTMRVWLETDSEKVYEGTWGSMSDALYTQGARYTKLLYVVTDFGNGKLLACLHLKGRAFSRWLDFLKKTKIDPCGDVSFLVKAVEIMDGTKGEPSLVPVFETGKLSAETKAIADEMDTELQAWLKSQFEQSDIPAITQSRTAGAQDVYDSFPDEQPEYTKPAHGDDLPF